jgi:hypothetical protein
MILKYLLLFVALLIQILVFNPLNAQFLRFSLEIVPEVNAGVLQELNFGLLGSNMSRTVNAQDPSSGWFQIMTLNASEVSVNIVTPRFLILESQSDCQQPSCRMEVNLEFGYFIGSGPEIPSQVSLQNLTDGFNFIPIPNIMVESRNIMEQYVFVHVNVAGRLNAGDIIPGSYTGEVLLEIVY